MTLLILGLRGTGKELLREDSKVVTGSVIKHTVSYDVLNHNACREQKIAVKGKWHRLNCTNSLNASSSAAAR
jgi:hypothetical protein